MNFNKNKKLILDGEKIICINQSFSVSINKFQWLQKRLRSIKITIDENRTFFKKI